MEDYVQLVRAKSKADELTPPDRSMKSFLIQAVDFTEYVCDGQLSPGGPWRLDDTVVRRLRDRYTVEPPGGWNNLVRIAAGGGYFQVGEDGFEPTVDVSELAKKSARRVQCDLAEAYTRALIPPSTAAGLFLLLDLHPAWGLRLAKFCQRKLDGDSCSGDRTEGGKSDDLSDKENPKLALSHKLVFRCLGAIFGVLRSLDSDGIYPLDGLTDVVSSISNRVRRQVARQMVDRQAERFDLFIGDAGQRPRHEHRVADFTCNDLFHSVLVPTGLARKYDDGTFQIRVERLRHIRVGEMDGPAQRRLLGDYLHTAGAAEPAC